MLYHTALDTDPKKGTGTGIYARDAKTGKVLWSADVAEQANQIIVANGRLFAATRQGTIYSFAPQGAKLFGVINEPVEEDPFKGGEAFGSAADTMLKQSDVSAGHATVLDSGVAAEKSGSGVKAGYAIVLDCESGQLAYELAKRTKLYVMAVFGDADKAAAARKAYSRAGMHVSRIVAYHQKEGTKLPFASYIADLIVSESAVNGGALPKDTDEIARLLKPIRGVALLGGKQTKAALKDWTDAKRGWKVSAGAGNEWAKRVRPRLKESGGWTHDLGDAGHTGSSDDGALKPPLGIYWYGEAQLGRPTGGIRMIDGVFFIYRGRDLAAYDQYTGREMWRRANGATDLVSGRLAHISPVPAHTPG